jgi:hypothetical protein
VGRAHRVDQGLELGRRFERPKLGQQRGSGHTLAIMSRACEICTTEHGSEVRAEPATHRKIRRLLIEDRVVSLCEAHAARYRASGKSTLLELAAMFREESGRRSLIMRRAPLDRRVFPARPEGRRRNEGRRRSDDAD